MNFSPGSPIFIILIIVLFFGLGVLFGKMFIKKKKNVEKFSVNAPMSGVPIDMPLMKTPGFIQGNMPGYEIKDKVLA